MTKGRTPDFADVDRRILAALDLRAEFESLGVEIVDGQPGPKGYVSCRAVGRDDATPSAGVNLESGRYKDFGGDGESLSFWDFCAKHGGYHNWRAAREHYSGKTGIALPDSTKGSKGKDAGRAKKPNEQLHWLPWNATQVALWTRHKPGVTAESLEAAGGRLARYLDKYVVVCLPAWGRGLLDADPVGYVVWNISGKPLPVFGGKGGEPTKHVKMKTVAGSQSGLMNRFALGRLAATAKASEPLTIWKVEGPSDALTLQAAISESLRDSHLVVTNSGGANEHPTAEIAALFAGHRVFVLHDADEAGESGATEHWLPGLHPHAAEIKHVRLPFEIAKDHGKDLRDWLNAGGTYNELLAIAEAAPIWQPPKKEKGKKKTAGPQHDQSEDESESDEQSTEDPGTLSNCSILVDDDGREQVEPYPMSEVLANLYERTDNWPRRVGSAIFTHDQTLPNSPVDWLDSAPAAFGWLAHRCGVVEFRRNSGCVTKEEVFHELKRGSMRYDAVEELPHFPPLTRHYYACQPPEPGNGQSLAKLVQFFSPDSDADYNLILAMFATPFWGGAGGARPCFVITASEGRGIGKTKLSDVLSLLVGGHVEVSQQDEAAVIRQRLLSPEGINKRLARLDNVKSLRFSWADLESIITTPFISGKRMYVGEAARPNTLTWVVTLNGVALSTDMAQRSIVIKLRKPDRRPNWEADVVAHVVENRQAIIADIRHFLELPSRQIATHSRWAAWEGDVLAKLPNVEELKIVIRDRAAESDADADDAMLIEEFFEERLEELDYSVATDQIVIPSTVAADWYVRATHEKRPINHACRILHQAIGEGKFSQLSSYRSKSFRGFAWNFKSNTIVHGLKNPDIHMDILSRIQTANRKF